MKADQVVRDMKAQNAALRQYALAHDRFAELEQLLVEAGSYVEAEGARTYAAICVRAYQAESRGFPPEAEA